MTFREERALAAGILAALCFIGFWVFMALGKIPVLSTYEVVSGMFLIGACVLTGMAGAYLDNGGPSEGETK